MPETARPRDPGHAAGIGALTHGRVLRIAVPIVAANITVPVLGLVDTGVVGQMGLAAPIGAVGLGAVVLTTVYWVFGFLRMGTSGLVAQARGASDSAEAMAILVRALIIAAAAGLVLIALQAPLARAAFTLAPASAEVEALTRDYLAIRIWGAPATIALYALSGWLIASERTRGVLGLQLWINGLNIVLDLWFVLGLGWGVQGVAAATLIAEWTGLALGLWLCRSALGSRAWRDPRRLLDGARLRRMLQVNTDIMIRSVALQLSFAAFLFIGAGFGDVTLAANQVLLQFLAVIAYGLDGFAFAAEALVGQAVGARSRPAMRRAAVVTSMWGLGSAVALMSGLWLLGPWAIEVMARSEAVQLVARAHLPWVVLAAILSLGAYMFDGIYIGATGTRQMRNTVLLSAMIYVGAIWVLLPVYGNHGLWAALLVFNISRGVALAVLYPALERGCFGVRDKARLR